MQRFWKFLFAVLCSAGVASFAHGETPAAPSEKKAAVGVDVKALGLLRGMSDTLAKAKSMSFNVRRAFDEPAATGQPLFYFVNSNVSLQRPDKLKVVVLGDGPTSEFYYDGKEMAAYFPDSNLIAVETAPANLDDMLETAFTKAGIYFPFVDFIVSDPYKEIAAKLTSAFVVGQSNAVGGVTTDIVAIANPEFQAQLWIGAKDKLPRLIWITPTDGKEKSRSMVEFSNWRLNAPTLKFARAAASAKAGKIKFARPGEAAAAKP
jgi:hypothetical protein